MSELSYMISMVVLTVLSLVVTYYNYKRVINSKKADLNPEIREGIQC